MSHVYASLFCRCNLSDYSQIKIKEVHMFTYQIHKQLVGYLAWRLRYATSHWCAQVQFQLWLLTPAFCHYRPSNSRL